MTETPATPAPAPALTLESALAAFKTELSTLTPDEQTRINYALTDLLPLIAELAEGAAHPWFAKVPIFGKSLEAIADGEVNKEEGTILAMLVPAVHPNAPAAQVG